MTVPLSVVMLGASGAVGHHVVDALASRRGVQRITLLNRRLLANLSEPIIEQHAVDVLNSLSYRHLLVGHHSAVCTFGVGQPSKVSKDSFIKIDKDAVIEFAIACKQAGIEHFELLSSVAADANASGNYLRTKGELQDALIALNFKRLSIFQPSMILTPTNRYGVMQAILLAVWPKLSPLLLGSWRKYRGVDVKVLGTAMANNLLISGEGAEIVQWNQFIFLVDGCNALALQK